MLRVLLVADIVYYREALEVLLRSRQELILVGSVATHDLDHVLQDDPSLDIVLLDISSPGAQAALARLRALVGVPRIVALSDVDGPERIVDWVEAGVVAHIPDTASLGEMLNILQCACRGQTHCAPEVIQAAFVRLAALAGESRVRAATDVELTRRESEIVELLERGLSNKVIARKLGISDATAKNHVHRILEKFKLQSRAEIASRVAALRRSGGLVATRGLRSPAPRAALDDARR